MMKIMTPLMLLGMMLSSISLMAKTIDQQLSADGIVAVKIENLRGKVRINGADTKAISVIGKLDEKAQNFVFKHELDKVLIQVQMPKQMNSSFWHSEEEESNLTITLPDHLAVEFTGVSTDVKVSEINSEVFIQTVSGDIKAADLSTKVSLKTVSGNIDAKNLSGEVVLSTVSGNINDKESKGQLVYRAVSGNIDASSKAQDIEASIISGNIDLNLDQIENANLSSISGHIEVSMVLRDQGRVKLSSVSGNTDLQVQEGVNAEFKVYSNADGKIINRVTKDQVKRAKYGPSSKLTTSTGKGSASVKASTVSGKVKIHY